ncbi:MAG: DUF1109 domain-containing protein [Betaproteobacteria bacterium]|nr:MAG: DUF1109 domain-containing protein [Betaproteobacteria bacterium]
MKTDDLISMLAHDAPPVDRRAYAMKVALALLGAAALSFAVMVVWMSINPKLAALLGNLWFWVRFAFIASLAALTWWALSRLGKPGAARSVSLWPLVVPVLVLGVVGVWMLIDAPADRRLPMILGVSWDVCSRNIAMLSIPLFLASIWVARQFAPTRLRVTGAVLGFFSGAVGALIYSMHCPELSPSFLMIWYTLGMLIPAVIGALLGRRLLAW